MNLLSNPVACRSAKEIISQLSHRFISVHPQLQIRVLCESESVRGGVGRVDATPYPLPAFLPAFPKEARGEAIEGLKSWKSTIATIGVMLIAIALVLVSAPTSSTTSFVAKHAQCRLCVDRGFDWCKSSQSKM
jgi:hypothetical protein